MRSDGLRIRGRIRYWLLNPDGSTCQYGEAPNLVTAVGDQMYLDGGARIAGAPGPPTGMRLGTGATAPAKTGTGSSIVTYLSGSSGPLDTGYPLSTTFGSSRRVQYARTWPAGVATTTEYITEVVLTNESPLTDYAGVEADTVARALLHPAVIKPADRPLLIVWDHDAAGT